MSEKKKKAAPFRKKRPAGYKWPIFAMFAILFILFFIPGNIADDRAVSAMALMQSTAETRIGTFPAKTEYAVEMLVYPALTFLGMLLSLVPAKGIREAFGACFSGLLFFAVGSFRFRYLASVGGFAVPAAMILLAGTFFLCVFSAFYKR